VDIDPGQRTKAVVSLQLDELRVLVHRLSPEGSFIHGRAAQLLPENHEQIADDMAEKLRRFHDRDMRRHEEGTRNVPDQ
jgi:hypothetical protein